MLGSLPFEVLGLTEGMIVTNKTNLTVIDRRGVTFYDDEITAVMALDPDKDQVQVFIPLRPICGFLGVQWAAQSKRIRRDPVLSSVAVSVSVMDTQSTPAQHRAMTCLPLDYLNGWLFGINANRVKDEVRERLIRYQRECYRVLADAFLERLPPAELPPSTATLIQVREMGLAIARMAEEQIEFDRRLVAAEGRIDKAAAVYGDLTKRVITLEKRTAPGEAITDEQASQLSQAVKAVAMELGEQTGKNEYGGVYGELYRRFGITSYKLLPAGKFREAMDWLSEWYSSIAGGDVPF